MKEYVKYISFASNFLWVMILALLGPSLPGIIDELGIGYAKAGLFFGIISTGSLFGTFIGSIATDYLDKKLLFLSVAIFLTVSLLLITLSHSFLFLILALVLLSVAGSPIGAIGQSIMLFLFPKSHTKNLSIQGIFTAAGSFLAPLLVSLAYVLKKTWRLAFLEAAGIGIILFVAMLPIKIPVDKRNKQVQNESVSREQIIVRDVFAVFKIPGVLFSFIMLVVYVGIDFGFSYWLAEFMRRSYRLSYDIASGSVLFYLAGVIIGRTINVKLVGRVKLELILKISPLLALCSFLFFILKMNLSLEFLFIVLYGIAISPIFPLLLSLGTSSMPENPGTTTGILFASLSIGGMIFPPLIGVIANLAGLSIGYLIIPFLLLVLLVFFNYGFKRLKRFTSL